MNSQFEKNPPAARPLVRTGKALGALLLSCFSVGAFAHPGHGEGFAAAFAHPFSGLDHLLMMVFVGIWAGRSGGSMRWKLPATFLSAMLGGWICGRFGLHIAGLDSGIAATLIVLGVLLALQVRLQRSTQMLLVGAFALLHGLAHGGELTGGTWQAAAGMLFATALLHLFGLTVTLLIPQQRGVVYRAAGALLAVLGGGLLALG